MKSIARTITEALAEQEAVTPKQRIIRDYKIAIGSCAIAVEEGRVGSAREIFEELVTQSNIEPSGVVDIENWQHTLRIIGANLVGSGEIDQVMAGLGTWGDPLVMTCRASHPSMGEARLSD